MALNEIINACTQENRLLMCLGAQAKKGGEWDVRTRFVTLVRSTEFGPKLYYNFNLKLEGEEGRMAIDFIPHGKNAFYLSAILAACAFGSGEHIGRVVVTSHFKCFFGPACSSFEFERNAFLQGFYPYLSQASACERTMRDSAALMELLKPVRASFELGVDGRLLETERLEIDLPSKHTPLQLDERPLSNVLRFILCADEARDLDHAFLVKSEKQRMVRIHKLMEEADEFPVYCISELESMLAEHDVYEESLERQRAYGESDERWLEPRRFRPLYCDDQLARAIVTLYDIDPVNRYLRVPESAYVVRLRLARLYRKIGDPYRALGAAQACIALAPTSTSGYLESIRSLFDMGRYTEGCHRVVTALKFALKPEDINQLYYLLGYGFERENKHELALAAFAMVGPEGGYAEKIAAQISSLKIVTGQAHSYDEQQAKTLLASCSIPIAPNPEALMTISKAAVMLTDEGLCRAAAPLVKYLGRHLKDKVLLQTAVSLKFGLVR